MRKRNNNGITNYHNFLIWENDRLFTSSCGDKVNKCDTAAPNEKCKKRYFWGTRGDFPPRRVMKMLSCIILCYQ